MSDAPALMGYVTSEEARAAAKAAMADAEIRIEIAVKVLGPDECRPVLFAHSATGAAVSSILVIGILKHLLDASIATEIAARAERPH